MKGETMAPINTRKSNLLNWIFKGKKDLQTRVDAMDAWLPNFSGKYDPELNSTYVAICNAHAQHLSKIKPVAVLKGEIAESRRYLNRILSLRPNPIMTASVFYETMARNYWMQCNAFAFLEYDWTNYKEPLKAIWPLDPDENSLRAVVRESDRKVFVGFTLNGMQYNVSLDQLVVISRNVNPSDLFGKTSKAADAVLHVIQKNLEGVEQAIETSAFIRFLLVSKTPINIEEKLKRTEEFAKAFLNANSSHGIAYADLANEVIPIESKGVYAAAPEMKEFRQEIFQFLTCNEKILTASFNEDEWQAYQEAALEPFMVKLADELTYKLFTAQELSWGNQIEVDSNRLQTASLKTRIMLADKLLRLPLVRPNMIAEVLYLPKFENGDREFVTLNYTDADTLADYQGTIKPKTKPKKEDKPEADPEEPKEDKPA